MPHRDSRAICRQVDAALDYIGDDEEQLRPWLIYQIDEIMAGPKCIDPEDCTTPELMALLAVLAPIFSRRLGGSLVTTATPAKTFTLVIGGVGGESSTGT